MSASDERLYFLIQRAAHLLKKRADEALTEKGGMTTAQAAVMAILVGDGPSSQRHVADRLEQRESAITTMAARLMSAGLVTRTRSETDRRAWVLEATADGRAAHQAMRLAFRDVNAVLDEVFVAEDMQRLSEGLRALLTRLGTDR